MSQLPGVLIGLWAVASFWIVGNGKRYGWMLAALSEAGWAAYALWLHQYGLLITVAFFTPVYLRNWFKWAPDADVIDATAEPNRPKLSHPHPWLVIDTWGENSPIGCWTEEAARRLPSYITAGYETGRYVVVRSQ